MQIRFSGTFPAPKVKSEMGSNLSLIWIDYVPFYLVILAWTSKMKDFVTSYMDDPLECNSGFKKIIVVYNFTSYYNLLVSEKVRSLHWKFHLELATQLCGIIMQHILLIFDFFHCLHGLLGTASLLILLKNSYLHFYLELTIHYFRGKFVNFTWYMLQSDPLTCLIHFYIPIIYQFNIWLFNGTGNFLAYTF